MWSLSQRRNCSPQLAARVHFCTIFRICNYLIHCTSVTRQKQCSCSPIRSRSSQKSLYQWLNLLQGRPSRPRASTSSSLRQCRHTGHRYTVLSSLDNTTDSPNTTSTRSSIGTSLEGRSSLVHTDAHHPSRTMLVSWLHWEQTPTYPGFPL